MPTPERITTPETRLATQLRALATLLDTPHRPGHADCGCPRDRARTWTEHGYPTTTLGDGTGSRTSDPTSSTERAAAYHPAIIDLIGGLGTWDDLIRATTDHATRLANLAHLLLATATTTDDPIAVGRGNCLRCERFVIGDGGNNRLRAGLCYPCYHAFRRWRDTRPEANVADFNRASPPARHRATM